MPQNLFYIQQPVVSGKQVDPLLQWTIRHQCDQDQRPDRRCLLLRSHSARREEWGRRWAQRISIWNYSFSSWAAITELASCYFWKHYLLQPYLACYSCFCFCLSYLVKGESCPCNCWASMAIESHHQLCSVYRFAQVLAFSSLPLVECRWQLMGNFWQFYQGLSFLEC